jgi:PKD repeat protein
MNRILLPFLSLLLLGGILSSSAQAQDKRPDDTFYIKAGGGVADYTGDATGTAGVADLFETDKFDDGINDTPFPFALVSEVGYQTSPALSFGVGYQFGQYPLVDNLEARAGESIETARHLVQVLGRYTFKAQDWTVAPYIDGGVNASFGGVSTGVGYSVGIGLDAAVSSRVSLFLEGRFNTVFDDEATDGIDGDKPGDSLNPLPVAGVQVNFKSAATAPRVISVDGPTSVRTGEEVTYTASVNAEEADRPLTYQWDFGDGSTGSGMTTNHTFQDPGTYTVQFTASNEAGEASQTLTVTAEEPPQPAQVVSVNADPNPADEGTSVSFSANVGGDSPISYNWNFGDGATGSGESPTHTYDEPGTYTVELTASNEAGESSRTLTMTVERALPSICMSVSELNSAFFARNSSTLTDEGEESLQENLEILTQCPNLNVQIDGFAAPNERNVESLSEDRAEAVADFYENEGISSNRIMTEGQGAPEGVTTKKGDTQQYRRADSIPER